MPKPTGQEVSDEKYLKADGTWDNPSGGGSTSADEIFLGSTQLYGSTGNVTSAKTNFYAASAGQIKGGITIPDGYSLYFSVSAVLQTEESNYAILYINDTELFRTSTWSGDASSPFYNHYGGIQQSAWYEYTSLPTAARYMDNTGSGYYNFNLRNTNTSWRVEAHSITIHRKLVKNS